MVEHGNVILITTSCYTFLNRKDIIVKEIAEEYGQHLLCYTVTGMIKKNKLSELESKRKRCIVHKGTEMYTQLKLKRDGDEQEERRD